MAPKRKSRARRAAEGPLRLQRECEERYIKDFGNRMVVNYDTGETLGTVEERVRRLQHERQEAHAKRRRRKPR